MKKRAPTPNYNRLNEWPLQFLRSGAYHRSYGYIIGQVSYGYWWSNTVQPTIRSYYLYSGPGGVDAQSKYLQGIGYALRCVCAQRVNLPF